MLFDFDVEPLTVSVNNHVENDWKSIVINHLNIFKKKKEIEEEEKKKQRGFERLKGFESFVMNEGVAGGGGTEGGP